VKVYLHREAEFDYKTVAILIFTSILKGFITNWPTTRLCALPGKHIINSFSMSPYAPFQGAETTDLIRKESWGQIAQVFDVFRFFKRSEESKFAGQSTYPLNRHDKNKNVQGAANVNLSLKTRPSTNTLISSRISIPCRRLYCLVQAKYCDISIVYCVHIVVKSKRCATHQFRFATT
jgi:hypothetical protein